MRKILLSLAMTILLSWSAKAQEYNATMFGIVSDGLQNNTGAIQYAIDFISQKGGGKLNFFVGRYLTGSLELKSNVTIELHEGAVLLASPNWNDYLPNSTNQRALLKGEHISNFKLIGKGVIEAQPRKFYRLTSELNEKGHIAINDNDYPSLMLLNNCKQITVEGILFQQFVNKALITKESTDLQLKNIIVRSQEPHTVGLILENSSAIHLESIYLETKGKAVEKDQQTTFTLIQNCITANGKSAL